MEKENFSQESAVKVEDLVSQNMVRMFERIKREGIGLDEMVGWEQNRKNPSLTRTLRKYDSETVAMWLDRPGDYVKELRNLSLYLLQSTTLYYRAIQYMASTPQLCPVLLPNEISTDIVSFRKEYFQAAKFIQFLNLPHEFVKIFFTLFSEGIFYGIQCVSGDSFYIKKLNPDYCQVNRVQDGCYGFLFDFSFFDLDLDRGTDSELLDNYAQIWKGFRKGYNAYLQDRNKRWQPIPDDLAVCFRVNEGATHDTPIFVNTFDEFCRLQSYKQLNLIKTQNENYQLLALEMDVNNKSGKPNDFTVSVDVAQAFFDMILNNLPQGVGAILSPVKTSPIKFDQKSNQLDQVANATTSLFDSLGLSPVLFSGASNAGTLKYSTKLDESLIFGIYRQAERWINRKLKQQSFNFHTTLLNLTIYSRTDVQDELLKLASASVPVKVHLGASVGLSPLDLITSSFLESDVLQIQEKWQPLSSSHTQSGSQEAGRPSQGDDQLSDAGEVTRDYDSNANREGAV